MTPSPTIPGKWSLGICGDGHPGYTSEDTKYKLVRTGNDGLLHGINDSCSDI